MNNADHNPRKAKINPGRGLIAIVLFSGLTVGLVLATDTSRPIEVGEAVSTPAPQPAVKPRAGHSDYLVGLTRKALREGFGKDAVLVLEPAKGPGREAVAKQLRALAARKDSPLGPRLTESGLKAARPDDRNTAFVGPFSSLKVSADGTKFHFRGNIDDQNALQRARGAGRMIQKDELEKIGRHFIDAALRDIVRLGPEESLVFLGSRYLREEAISADGKQRKEEISANVAVFGREVRGVPVIGSGSKIAVWFANDRQPVGVDVDWPVYKVLRTRQGVLSRDRLFERVRATTIPTSGTTRSAVSRFECGYVDLGATRRGAGIQSGCAIHYDGRNDDGSSWARVEYVPAGEQVFTDAKWPLARMISEGKVVNTGTSEFINYASTKKPAEAARVPGTTGPRPR